jgi:hypothetical protein
MRVFDRDFDELEEWIVCFALIFLISSIIFLAFGPFLGAFVFLPAVVRSLSLTAASVAVLLWLLRRLGSSLCARLRNPEKNRIQTIMCEKTPPLHPEQQRANQ